MKSSSVGKHSPLVASVKTGQFLKSSGVVSRHSPLAASTKTGQFPASESLILPERRYASVFQGTVNPHGSARTNLAFTAGT